MVNLGRLLALFAGVLYTGMVSAQEPDSTFWVPDGPVHSLVIHDTTVILGGDFHFVTPVTGSFVRMDTGTAQVDQGLFKVDGIVYATATDRIGNVYVGGRFSRVGGTAVSNLFRMKPDGTFDHSFSHTVLGTVYCLAVHDTDLFLGGEFTAIDGEPRNNFGGVSLTSGVVNLCDPDVNGPVYCCAIEEPGAIVIGGDFNQVGNAVPPFIAKISMQSGATYRSSLLVWTAVPNIDGPVYDIEIADFRCYIAGEFTMAGGSIPCRGLAALLNSGGILLPADAQLDGPVYSILREDTTFYIGGSFSTVDGEARANVAQVGWNFDVKPWNPGANGTVRALYPLGRKRLFVGGEFTEFAEHECSHGALVRTDVSVLEIWNPQLNGPVYTAVCDTMRQLYLGGAFFGAAGAKRSNLCSISLNTGRVTDWDPDVNAAVHTVALDGDSVYFAGDFTTVGTTARSRIAAIDLANETLLPFNPGCNGLIRTIAVTNTDVYAGGNFSTLGGQPRSNIGKINKSTGVATNWNAGCLGTVNTILATPNWIYVAGYYSTVGAASRENLARIHPLTGLADANWICDTDDGIYHADFYNGQLAIGGWFSQVNGSPSPYFALIDTVSLQAQTLNLAADGYVRTFSHSGDDFFVSGMFEVVNASYRRNLLAYDAGDDAMDPWTPFPDQFPLTMQATPARLFIGGQMTTTANRFQPYFQVLPVQWVTGINETQTPAASAVHVFPNPSDDKITITSTAAFGEYILTDVTGQVVMSAPVNATTVDISLATLAPGMYVLTLTGTSVNPVSQVVIRQ